MGTHSKIGLAVAGCLALLIAFGCAQQKASAPPLKPRAAGLVVSGKFQTVAIEDMDNDGNPDVVGGASSPGMVTISYGDGRGAVSEPQILPVHGEVRSVAVADFNEDGLNDIAFAVQRETTGIRLWINESNRKWKQQNGPSKVNLYENLKTGDVNGDGHSDLIAANSTEDSQAGIQVWLGNGRGGWITESGPTTTGRYMDVMIADLNKDGAPDLIGAGWGTYGALRVWLGDGNAKWSSTAPLSKGSYYGVSVGDVNQDGNLDILAASFRAGIQIFLGDGKGDFIRIEGPIAFLVRRDRIDSAPGKRKLTLTGGESFWKALAVDLDGDGRVDIVASSLDSLGLMAWRNKGKQGWEKFKGQFPSSGVYHGMALADLNADGHLDICAASYGEGIQIWPGNSGTVIKSRLMEIEQLPAGTRRAALAVPLENDVFVTVNGIAEYKMGPGDVLEITYWEANTPKKEEVLVRPDGKISFGFVEDLFINNLTLSQLDDRLTKYLKKYLRKPRLDVIVKEYNSKTVTIMGAIAFKNMAGTGTGKYRLKGKMTLLEMLTQAGGPAQGANLSSINIRRKTGETVTLDLFKALQHGDPGQDFILNAGDVVFIPFLAKDENRVYVFGEVKKPGTYAFQRSKMHLLDAISEAGGPTAFAAAADTKVVRGDPTKPEIITTNLRHLVEKGDQSQNIALVSGDLVYVPRNGFGQINLFAEQIRPLLELLIWPARLINDWDRGYDVIRQRTIN